MSNNISYNGYTNYETWNVSLWIDNDYEVYKNKSLFTDTGKWSKVMAKAFFEYHYGETTPDLKKEDMKLVNWEEVAEVLNGE